jgi:DNA polymerase-3 subunit epsilon
MLVCVYDLETTGLSDPIYPVEVAAVLIEIEPPKPIQEIACISLFVRPDGYSIPIQATQVHGISQLQAERSGVPAIVVIAALTNLWSVAEARVAHNAEYDDKVIWAAMSRLKRKSTLARPSGLCTMKIATPLMNLPPTEKMIKAGYGDKPKSPSLNECYKFLFNEDIVGAHRALTDARACARVFNELVLRGCVNLV